MRPSHPLLAKPLCYALGAAALASWAYALSQALPRLMAGPLCTSRSDAFSLAGHCPACFVAAAFTLAFGVAIALARRSEVAGRLVSLPVQAQP